MRAPPVEARRGFKPQFSLKSSAYEAFPRRGETPRWASGWRESPIWGPSPAADEALASPHRREPPSEAPARAPSPWLFAAPPRPSSAPESNPASARDSARRFWSEAPARLARDSEARDLEFEALAAGVEEDEAPNGPQRGEDGRPAAPTPEPGSIAARLTQWREELRGAPRPPAAPGGPAGGGLASAAAALAHQPILPSAAELPLDPSRWAAATYAQAPAQAIVREEPQEPQSLWERLIQAFSGGRGKGGLLAALLGGGGGEAQAARRAVVSGGGGGAEGGGESAAPRAQRAERAEGEGRSSPEERRQTERARRRQEAETPLEATPTPYRLET